MTEVQQREDGADTQSNDIGILTEHTANLNDVLLNMHTLDLVCFRGTDAISVAIQKGQQVSLGCGEYSHVGIIVRPEDIGKLGDTLDSKQVYVLESTMLSKDLKDALIKKKIQGVCIRPIKDVVKSYNGDVCWAPLIKNPFQRITRESDKKFVKRKLALRIKMEKLCKTYHGESYAGYGTVWPLLSAVFPCLRKVRDIAEIVSPDLSGRLFCSELVARIYKQFKVLDKDQDPRDVIPMDLLGYDKDGIKCLVSTIVKIR